METTTNSPDLTTTQEIRIPTMNIHDIIATVASKRINNAANIDFVRCGLDVDSARGKSVAKAVALAIANQNWRNSLTAEDIEHGLPVEDCSYGYLLAMLECDVVTAAEVLAIVVAA